MSALIYILEENQVIIAMDTLSSIKLVSSSVRNF